jgi:hypothetical protein
MLDVRGHSLQQLHEERLHSSLGGRSMIAAERTLYIQTKGAKVAVPISIEVPFYERDAWTCNFSIGWPEGVARHHGMGLDGVQALKHALTSIAIHLYASPYHRDGTLQWDQLGAGYGFPLPAGGRDLAIGDDKLL